MSFKSKEEQREYMKNYMRDRREKEKAGLLPARRGGKKKNQSEPFGLVRVSYFREIGR